MKYPIRDKSKINPAVNFVDSESCKILDSGKTPYIEVGIYDEQTELAKKKYHAMIEDIRSQAVIKQLGLRIVMKDYSYPKCKAMLFVWYARECELNGEPLRNPPSYFECPLTGQQITERSSTKDMDNKESSGFVTFLEVIGAECGVIWSDPKLKKYESYREAQ